MLTAFVTVQIGVNLALIIAVFLLLRERTLTARLARAREDRLEALAAEFCALGREVTTLTAPPTIPGAAPRDAEAPRHIQEQSGDLAIGQSGDRATGQSGNWAIGGAGDQGAKSTQAPDCQISRSPDCQIAHLPEAADRLKTAAALLDHGLSVAAVAARTAIPDGEIQVLKNLRRSQAPARRCTTPRKRQAAAPGEGTAGELGSATPGRSAAQGAPNVRTAVLSSRG